MGDEQTILVTGVAGYWGGRLARELIQQGNCRVLGLDQQPPTEPMPELDFIQADFRDPLLQDLLEVEPVDTVCHLAFRETTRHSEEAFDLNVMGAMKFFTICAAAGVRRIIYKSSTELYGAYPDNPAHLTEAHPLRAGRQLAYNRYRLELESFLNGFSRQHPGTEIVVLRFAGIVGPTADTPFTRYLGWDATPTLTGFNPMTQVIHEDDVVAALAHAALSGVAGVFNVAAEPAMPLKRLLALAGVRPLPLLHPLAYTRRLNPYRRRMSLEADYLRYRWTVDTARMSEELGFAPQLTADEAARTIRQRKKTPARRQTEEAKALPLHMVIEARRKAKAQVAEMA